MACISAMRHHRAAPSNEGLAAAPIKPALWIFMTDLPPDLPDLYIQQNLVLPGFKRFRAGTLKTNFVK